MKLKKNDNKLNYYDKRRITVVLEPHCEAKLEALALKEKRKLGTMGSIVIERALFGDNINVQD